MRVIKIKEKFAWVKAGGLIRQINIQMVPNIKLNDYVIVHAGFAIEKINPESAEQTLRLFEDMR